MHAKYSPARILIFQTAFLGDAILCIPLIKAVKNNFPNAKVMFVCRQGVGEIFKKSLLVDRVVEVAKSNSESLRKAFDQTREFNAELILSPHQSFRSALWVWRLKAAIRVGFKSYWNFLFFSHRVFKPNTKHDVLRQLSLLKALNINVDQLDSETLSTSVKIIKNPAYAQYGGSIAMAPGSQWKTKQWTESGYTELAVKYLKNGFGVVIVGTKDEKDLCSRIVQNIISMHGPTEKLVNKCGETNVYELAQLLKESKFLVCNDSGAMHVAGLVNTPVVAVFGPTVPAQGYAPWGNESRVVEVNLTCRPCGAHGHLECPIGTHDCMKKVSSETIWISSQDFIK